MLFYKYVHVIEFSATIMAAIHVTLFSETWNVCYLIDELLFLDKNVFLIHSVWETIVCAGEKKYLGLLNINGTSFYICFHPGGLYF